MVGCAEFVVSTEPMKSDPESLGMELPSHEVTARIVTLRGVQVMLDRDLADFYGVKPIRLREQVKRNGGRFPADFMFQLTEDEALAMVSQIAIPSWQQLGGRIETTKPTKFHEKVKSGSLGGGFVGPDSFVQFSCLSCLSWLDLRGFGVAAA